jgi:hypothetical protein
VVRKARVRDCGDDVAELRVGVRLSSADLRDEDPQRVRR